MLELFKKICKFHQCQRCTEKFWFGSYETAECNFRRCPKLTETEHPVQFYSARSTAELTPAQKSDAGIAALIATGEMFIEGASAVSEFLMDATLGVVEVINDVADIDDISRKGIGDSFD